jgi:beta-amylase
MLPLDSVWLREIDGRIVSMVKRERALQIGLKTLKRAGVKGVMVDVWWGIVERDGPRCYDFAGEWHEGRNL